MYVSVLYIYMYTRLGRSLYSIMDIVNEQYQKEFFFSS